MPIPLGLGIAGLGVAAASGGLSFLSAHKQNSEARRQFEQSMALQRYQYEDMKRYNSPANQVKLYRQAGINPALAMGQLPSSGAVGTASPGATSSFTQPDFSGLNVAADIAAMYDVRNSETAKNAADTNKSIEETLTKRYENKFAEDNFRWQKHLNEMRARLEESNLSLAQKTLDSQVEKSVWDAQMSRASAGIQLKLQGVADERFQAEITKLWCDAYSAVLSGEASVKQAIASVMNAQSTKNATDAQYGHNAAERAKYFNLLIDTMNEANETRRSEQFGNWLKGASVQGYGFGANLPYPVGLRKAKHAAR